MEREGYYNRNGWGIESRKVMGHGNESFEKKLINKERDLQRQWEKERIDKSKYNKRYKEISMEDRIPNYLRMENGREEIRALFKLKFRRDNLEEKNKYWLRIEEGGCLFCDASEDSLEHYVKEYEETRGSFEDLGKNKDEIVRNLWGEDLSELKGKTNKTMKG